MAIQNEFRVGRVNATEDIRQLTTIHGLSIAELEEKMRPGRASLVGFLGEKERLLEVMGKDNQFVVDVLGLSHQELARHLHYVRRRFEDELGDEFTYCGRRYRLDGFGTLRFQVSPFGDGLTHNAEITLRNLDNGKQLRIALLLPFLIDRYGFYEGKESPYRIEPEVLLEVFDFLKERTLPEAPKGQAAEPAEARC